MTDTSDNEAERTASEAYVKTWSKWMASASERAWDRQSERAAAKMRLDAVLEQQNASPIEFLDDLVRDQMTGPEQRVVAYLKERAAMQRRWAARWKFTAKGQRRILALQGSLLSTRSHQLQETEQALKVTRLNLFHALTRARHAEELVAKQAELLRVGDLAMTGHGALLCPN